MLRMYSRMLFTSPLTVIMALASALSDMHKLRTRAILCSVCKLNEFTIFSYTYQDFTTPYGYTIQGFTSNPLTSYPSHVLSEILT